MEMVISKHFLLNHFKQPFIGQETSISYKTHGYKTIWFIIQLEQPLRIQTPP